MLLFAVWYRRHVEHDGGEYGQFQLPVMSRPFAQTLSPTTIPTSTTTLNTSVNK